MNWELTYLKQDDFETPMGYWGLCLDNKLFILVPVSGGKEKASAKKFAEEVIDRLVK